MKTLTIIKAIGAGVTALYLGGKVASLTGTADVNRLQRDEAAQQWHEAAGEFAKALEDLSTDRQEDGLNVDLTRRVKPSDLLDSLNEMLKREGNMP